MSVVAPALAKLEAELDAALTEHRAEIVRAVARVLVAMAVQEHHGEAHPDVNTPKLCAACGTRLAAPRRTVCHSCRGKQRRWQEKLRRTSTVERDAELQAARNGHRGERARQIAAGERRPSMI